MTLMRPGDPRIQPGWRSRKMRYAAGLLILLTVVAAIVILRLREVQDFAVPRNTIVVVAALDGPDPQRYRVTDNVVTRLTRSLAGLEGVEIRRLDGVIGGREGRLNARRLGQRHRAALVLWGGYSATESEVVLTVELEQLAPGKTLPLPPVKDHIARAVLAEPDHFTVQQRLLDERGVAESLVDGLVRYEGTEYPEAVQDLSAVLDLARPPGLMREVLLSRGNAFLVWGKPQQAIEDYSKALQLSPAYSAAYASLGLAYMVLGKNQQAILEYNQAIQINPREAAAYIDRGVAYAVLGDDRKAIEEYNQALQIAPTDATAYLDRGVSYAALGDHRRAIRDFSDSARINSREATAYVDRGLSYAALENYQRAIADYSRALQIDSRSATAYYHRGVAYTFLRRHREAIADFSRAVEINPRYADAYRDRGTNYLISGKSQQALQDSSRAIEINPKDAQAYYMRGLSYVVRGEAEKAIEDLQKVLGISSDPVLRRQTEEQLSRLRRE